MCRPLGCEHFSRRPSSSHSRCYAAKGSREAKIFLSVTNLAEIQHMLAHKSLDGVQYVRLSGCNVTSCSDTRTSLGAGPFWAGPFPPLAPLPAHRDLDRL